jgi:hypothetical protein
LTGVARPAGNFTIPPKQVLKPGNITDEQSILSALAGVLRGSGCKLTLLDKRLRRDKKGKRRTIW